MEKYTSDNAKFVALYNDGFRYFYNVDSTFCWNQMGTDYFRGNRRNLDGYRMSSGATRSSNTVTSPGISVTVTASGWSTRFFAI